MEKTERNDVITMDPESPDRYGICWILRTPGASPVQMLAEAIVIQAAEDYREALQTRRDNPDHTESDWILKDCERFFRSKWYRKLSRVNGEMLIKWLQEEIEHDGERISVSGPHAE